MLACESTLHRWLATWICGEWVETMTLKEWPHFIGELGRSGKIGPPTPDLLKHKGSALWQGPEWGRRSQESENPWTLASTSKPSLSGLQDSLGVGEEKARDWVPSSRDSQSVGSEVQPRTELFNQLPRELFNQKTPLSTCSVYWEKDRRDPRWVGAGG